ncbi:NAD-dependent protein deacylase [Alginatibacterium sediminis]|uniref:NAD-dependent protein deacylase n=1 Tax=Alginatibacterium sediminis TaxID=2164068 RepID=A0A420EH98_9ALTE|nr:Sir2 family NAD+-dependent deacetylase [Alginatibacterium sediminis]RKF20034.1 NAD-dependent protein deacylase [Alginatibacterium sediminis]
MAIKNDKKRVVILTGAGISAESGIETFRDSNGLWEKHSVEDVATPEGYLRDPDLVQRFYSLRRAQIQEQDVKPNAAHIAIAQLEQNPNVELFLVTQNIDNLHERAGSKQVLHMHGELLRARCPQSGQTLVWKQDLANQHLCTCCQIPNPLRPHVVWFGEMPLGLDRIYHQLLQADMFVAIGTSCHVYPAGGFVHEAASQGARTVELNLEPSEHQHEFNEHAYGAATQVVPEFFEAEFGVQLETN